MKRHVVDVAMPSGARLRYSHVHEIDENGVPHFRAFRWIRRWR